MPSTCISAYGFPNSHEYVSKLVDESYRSGKPLTEIFMNDKNLQPYVKKFTDTQLEIILDPSKYLGIASKKAEKIANLWENKLKEAKLL